MNSRCAAHPANESAAMARAMMIVRFMRVLRGLNLGTTKAVVGGAGAGHGSEAPQPPSHQPNVTMDSQPARFGVMADLRVSLPLAAPWIADCERQKWG